MTRKDWKEWLQHPVTELYMKSLDEEIQTIRAAMGHGRTIHDDVGKTAMSTAQFVGMEVGLRTAIEHVPSWAQGDEDG